jgi:hypothetical protein
MKTRGRRDGQAWSLLGVVSRPRLERSEPAAEASELIRRQPGYSFGDFFDTFM